MIRAFACCAVLIAVRGASAQTPTSAPPTAPQPTPALADASSISACNAPSCPVVATADAPRDQHAILRQKLAELNCLQSEIDELRRATGTPQQLLINIRVVEVARTKCRQLGIDITPLTTISPAGADDGAEVLADSRTILPTLDRLRENNLAKIVAEPNLAVVCGRPAAFHMGGEIPMPSGPGQETVEYKPFGTQVNALATALGDERVRLELDARVSELDESKQQQIGEARVPGIHIRQVETGIDMQLGQTVVLFGGVQQRTERLLNGAETIDRTEEIELLFIVTVDSVEALDKHAVENQSLTATTAEGAYRTATTDSDRPAERSLRVDVPSAKR